MRTLYLLRHAKSDWSDDDADDHDRPLNKRGERAASLIGVYAEQNSYPIRGIFSSSARRAEDTAKRVREQLDNRPTLVTLPDLYHASPSVLLKRLQGLGDAPDHLMMVGHNPGLHDFIVSLLAESLRDTEPAKRVTEKYPTGALAVLNLPAESWSGVEMASGELVHYATPKDLV